MQISKETMKWMLDKQHMPSIVRQSVINDMPLLEGDLSFDTLPSQIQVHCCDIVEKQNASSSAEIAPCLSITILLKGKLSFNLGSKLYQFDNQDSSGILFINVVNQTEIFTRHLLENQRVKKVNLCINKQWLLNRSQSIEDSKKIQAIFSQGTQVYQPKIQQDLPELAESLMLHWAIKDFDNHIKAEHLALEIIGLCMQSMFDRQKPMQSSVFNQSKIMQQEQLFFRKFDSIAIQDFPLKDTADSLGVSVSTLQRRVKDKYQVTAIEYIRYKKLENAKKSLVIDELSIGEIAFIAGYSHASNFVTAFKKRFHMTPAEFRKSHS